MKCPKCGSHMVFEDPMGGKWCQSCDHAWHPLTAQVTQKLKQEKEGKKVKLDDREEVIAAVEFGRPLK